MLTPQETTEFTKGLVDQGKLIEAGWEGFKMIAYPHGMGAQQMDQLRNAFFAGAQHLFSCIINVLELDDEPTQKDLERMQNIHDELATFLDEFKRKYLTPAKGQG